jgi:uracil phosphoribosyltransferase
MAVQVLKARGVPEDHILFLNIIASPEGVKKFATKFPRLKVVTAFIDQVLQYWALCSSHSLMRNKLTD